ncbi:MAG: hypothetical protein WC107_01685 [Patescibacteria group bacterium]
MCTIAVGGAMVMLEKYGVDNTISGLWIGAFALSSGLMVNNWLKKREFDFKASSFFVLFITYGSIVVPLYMADIIGHPEKTLWGIDKIILGMILGSMFFYLGHLLYIEIRVRFGKPWFPFQKIAMPLLPLIILSIIFYLITK